MREEIRRSVKTIEEAKTARAAMESLGFRTTARATGHWDFPAMGVWGKTVSCDDAIVTLMRTAVTIRTEKSGKTVIVRAIPTEESEIVIVGIIPQKRGE